MSVRAFFAGGSPEAVASCREKKQQVHPSTMQALVKYKVGTMITIDAKQLIWDT